MPVTQTPHGTRHDVERQAPGHGGRGPDHKLPTGGGGDDDRWHDQPQGSRGPRERLTKYRIGIFLVLGVVLMFFLSLAITYFMRQGGGHIEHGHWVRDWTPIMPPSILWWNTALIIAASVALEVARRAMFHPIQTVEEWLGLGYLTGRRALPWLGTAVLLGALFLLGQYRAWLELDAQGVYYGTSAHFFTIFTTAHAAHLLLGFVVLFAAIWATCKRKGLEDRQILIDTTAWYWHGLAVVWIALFAIIRFAR